MTAQPSPIRRRITPSAAPTESGLDEYIPRATQPAATEEPDTFGLRGAGFARASVAQRNALNRGIADTISARFDRMNGRMPVNPVAAAGIRATDASIAARERLDRANLAAQERQEAARSAAQERQDAALRGLKEYELQTDRLAKRHASKRAYMELADRLEGLKTERELAKGREEREKQIHEEELLAKKQAREQGAGLYDEELEDRKLERGLKLAADARAQGLHEFQIEQAKTPPRQNGTPMFGGYTFNPDTGAWYDAEGGLVKGKDASVLSSKYKTARLLRDFGHTQKGTKTLNNLDPETETIAVNANGQFKVFKIGKIPSGYTEIGNDIYEVAFPDVMQ